MTLSEGAYPAPRRNGKNSRIRHLLNIPRDAQEESNRQAYLAKKGRKRGRKGRKNRHNQQG